MLKAFLRFETLTTEHLVRWIFVIFAVLVIVLGLNEACHALRDGAGLRTFTALVYTAVLVGIIRVGSELTLLLFLSLRKYSGK